MLVCEQVTAGHGMDNTICDLFVLGVRSLSWMLLGEVIRQDWAPPGSWDGRCSPDGGSLWNPAVSPSALKWREALQLLGSALLSCSPLPRTPWLCCHLEFRTISPLHSAQSCLTWWAELWGAGVDTSVGTSLVPPHTLALLSTF